MPWLPQSELLRVSYEEELDKVRTCDQDRPVPKGDLVIEAGY